MQVSPSLLTLRPKPTQTSPAAYSDYAHSLLTDYGPSLLTDYDPSLLIDC